MSFSDRLFSEGNRLHHPLSFIQVENINPLSDREPLPDLLKADREYIGGQDEGG